MIESSNEEIATFKHDAKEYASREIRAYVQAIKASGIDTQISKVADGLLRSIGINQDDEVGNEAYKRFLKQVDLQAKKTSQASNQLEKKVETFVKANNKLPPPNDNKSITWTILKEIDEEIYGTGTNLNPNSPVNLAKSEVKKVVIDRIIPLLLNEHMDLIESTQTKSPARITGKEQTLCQNL